MSEEKPEVGVEVLDLKTFITDLVEKLRKFKAEREAKEGCQCPMCRDRRDTLEDEELEDEAFEDEEFEDEELEDEAYLAIRELECAIARKNIETALKVLGAPAGASGKTHALCKTILKDNLEILTEE